MWVQWGHEGDARIGEDRIRNSTRGSEQKRWQTVPVSAGGGQYLLRTWGRRCRQGPRIPVV